MSFSCFISQRSSVGLDGTQLSHVTKHCPITTHTARSHDHTLTNQIKHSSVTWPLYNLIAHRSLRWWNIVQVKFKLKNKLTNKILHSWKTKLPRVKFSFAFLRQCQCLSKRSRKLRRHYVHVTADIDAKPGLLNYSETVMTENYHQL